MLKVAITYENTTYLSHFLHAPLTLFLVTLNISLKLITQQRYITPVVILHFTVITY